MKHKNIIYYIIIFFSVLSVSCITNRSTRYLQHIKGVSYAKAVITGDYKIKVNDEITILVYSVNAEVSSLFVSGTQGYTYLVFSDGTIDIPFVHKIKVEGLTVREATNEIERRLKEYIPDAETKIGLVNEVFYVIGDGNKKGAFPFYKEQLNIFEALALAGDLNQNANTKKVMIIREINNKKNIMEFDLRSDAIVDSEYYYVLPNDIIYLSRSKKGFYNITSFSSFVGMISSSLTFVLLVLNHK